MTHDFAQKLWPVTKLGARVIVAYSEVVPADFEHPKLFVPAGRPDDPKIAMNSATDGRQIRVAELVTNTAPGVPAETRPGEATGPVGGVTPAAPAAGAADEPTGATGTVQPLPAGSAPLPPTELRKSVETPTASEPIATDVSVAPIPPEYDLSKPEPKDVDLPRPPAPGRKADQPVKRSGQVAVFISRKEKKIFVRQGMVPVFDMPITIETPDQPLGTHVYTALGLTEDGAVMRWNVMTVPNDLSAQVAYPASRRRGREQLPALGSLKPQSSAAEALNRVQMPKEAVERISELLSPGSSLVISDEGLGRETGRMTEFIVLTR
jgi:hypothetical protein